MKYKQIKGRITCIEFTILKEEPARYITKPDHAVSLLRAKDGFNPLVEEMYLITTNIKNRVLRTLLVKGSCNMLLCTPADIFRHVFLCNATSFLLGHNHPSGDCNPSQEDVVFTKKISKGADLLGLNFMDHIIYTDDLHYSCKQAGLL